MFLVQPVYAQCPICIVTVGGGMLLARKLGIDDLLVSIWISALNVAVSFWMASLIKNEKIPLKKLLSNGYFWTLIILATTLAYFKFTGQIGHPANRLFGIDKIIFGEVLGTVVMIAGNSFYQWLKTRLGHTPFPYAKVVFPVGLVLVVTLIFKFAFNLY